MSSNFTHHAASEYFGKVRWGFVSLVVLVSFGCLSFVHGQEPNAPAGMPDGKPYYSLESFGPLATPDEASETLIKALTEIQEKGGGALLIGDSAPDGWVPLNTTQAMLRTPAPPAAAEIWGVSEGVTVLDLRRGEVLILPPQATGLEIARTVTTPLDSPPNGEEIAPLVRLDNQVVSGSTSYLEFLVDPVEAGEDRRFYVPTIRGLFPGMFLNAHAGPGYAAPVARLYVKSLGYDAEKKAHYVVADTDVDHVSGAVIHNKSHINAIKINTYAHNELQTFDLMNDRRHYSQGDAHLYSASFRYMGNIHSAAGDENGVLYSAFVYGKTDIFRAQVESFDPEDDTLIFSEKGATHAWTLGTGRPLINLNPEKWITGGNVLIVRPGSFTETPEDNRSLQDPVFEGKTYPTVLASNPATGFNILAMGGLILGSADAPWTKDVVGRFFAVDEENERVPEGKDVRRWYRITSMSERPDGKKVLRIQRHWWGAKEAGAPTLYNEENYTSDGNLKPLNYVIAPGAYVYDVTEGVLSDATRKPYGGGTWQRKLKIAPTGDRDSPSDFAAGDPIEQAIGPDPFHPVPMRAWMWEEIPSPWPSPVFDVANWGQASLSRPSPRATVFAVRGKVKGREDLPVFKEAVTVESPVNTVFRVLNATEIGVINIGKGEKDSKQTPFVQWLYNDGKGEVNLTVDTKTGAMRFDGAPSLSAADGLTSLSISGSDTAANNLRGYDVAVPAGSSSFDVTMPTAEPDAEYAVFVQTNWPGRRAVTGQRPDGFTITFDQPAPEKAQIHWILIR